MSWNVSAATSWGGITAMEDRPGMGDKKPRRAAIDVHVGLRIRLRRTLVKMTQEDLGRELGVSYQQVQKYERGVNRVGCSRLFDLSQVLCAPVSYFFTDLPEPVSDALDAPVISLSSHRDSLELMYAYDRILDATVRKRVSDLVMSLSPPVTVRRCALQWEDRPSDAAALGTS
jgi:transcriptional regulator with XRE-family HTH domain